MNKIEDKLQYSLICISYFTYDKINFFCVYWDNRGLGFFLWFSHSCVTILKNISLNLQKVRLPFLLTCDSGIKYLVLG